MSGTSSTTPPLDGVDTSLTPEQRKAYEEIGAALEAQKKLTDMGYVWHQGAWIDYREVHSEKEQPK